MVPDRTCGECSVCCIVPTIDCAELVKPPGVACRHLASDGKCSIYATRPGDCRAFFCGWRLFPLPEWWRPDLCGVLVVVGTDEAPDGRRDSVRFHLIDSVDKILWQPLVAYMHHLLKQGVPVFISVPGPSGHVAARVFLNGSANLRGAFASGDAARIAAVLMDAVQTCIEHPKEKVVFEHTPREPL